MPGSSSSSPSSGPSFTWSGAAIMSAEYPPLWPFRMRGSPVLLRSANVGMPDTLDSMQKSAATPHSAWRPRTTQNNVIRDITLPCVRVVEASKSATAEPRPTRQGGGINSGQSAVTPLLLPQVQNVVKMISPCRCLRSLTLGAPEGHKHRPCRWNAKTQSVLHHQGHSAPTPNLGT